MSKPELYFRHWDPHVHARRKPLMNAVLPQIAERMCGGILMPNTNPHLLTWENTAVYLEDVRSITPGKHWKASLYLTAETKKKDVLIAWTRGLIGTVKVYPVGGSTHSNESAPIELLLDKDSNVGQVLCMMQDDGIPLTVHGEVTHWNGQEVDPWDREARYYAEVAPRLRDLYPKLKRVSAHMTSREGAAYAQSLEDSSVDLFELTAHHLAVDRRAMYLGGFLRPDFHCLPVIKTSEHTAALRSYLAQRPRNAVAASDIAPHSKKNKYAMCCFGGVYTGNCSTELYLEMLENAGVIDFADDFLFNNAKRFFGDVMPNDPPVMRFVKEEWVVDQRLQLGGGDEVTPFGYGTKPEEQYKFQWKVVPIL